jgi:hypothetical protein
MLAATAVAAVFAGDAAAQYSPYQNPTGTTQPTFSPYLNLLRRGNSAALNYYGLVRPEREFREMDRNLQRDLGATQQQLRATESDVEGLVNPELPTTGGRAARFMDTGGYFGGGGTGGRSRFTLVNPFQRQQGLTRQGFTNPYGPAELPATGGSR